MTHDRPPLFLTPLPPPQRPKPLQSHPHFPTCCQPPPPNNPRRPKNHPTRPQTNWASRKTRPPPAQPAPTESQAVAHITFCARKADWYSARAAFQLYVLTQPPTQRLLGAYVNALCRANPPRLDDAHRILTEHPALDGPVARTCVVAALARTGRPDEALEEVHACRERGMDMSAPHAYTAVLHAYGVLERPDEAMEVLEAALADGEVKVDAAMFDAVIRAYGRVGKLRNAFEVLGMLRAKGFRPTDCTFEGLIYACAHAGGREGLVRRAFVIYDAAIAEDKDGPRVVNAVASAILRGAFIADGRAAVVLKRMKGLWEGGREALAAAGVDAERFRDKMRDLERLCVRAGQLGGRKLGDEGVGKNAREEEGYL